MVQIKIAPMPSSTFINISISNSTGFGILDIMNNIGQVIYSQVLKEKEIRINTNSWNKGLYILTWHSEDGENVRTKLIIN